MPSHLAWPLASLVHKIGHLSYPHRFPCPHFKPVLSAHCPHCPLSSNIVSPSSSSFSLQVLPFSQTAHICTFSSASLSCCVYGHYACTANSRCGLTYCFYMLMMVNLSLLWKALEIRARTADAVFEAFLHCALGLRLLFTVTLKSSLVSSSCLPLNTCGQDPVAYVHHFELTYVKLHCPKLMPSVSLFRQFCRASPSA